MKRVYSTICVIAILLSVIFVGCSKSGKQNDESKTVPNVMGVDYNAAKTVLESAGFEVVTIEADAESILPNSAWDRSVKKGIVFKVNDETYPDYSGDGIFTPVAQDNKVFVYYADRDYVYDKDINTDDDIAADENDNRDDTGTDENDNSDQGIHTETFEVDEETPAVPISEEADSSTRTEWKQFLNEYEEWVDRFVLLSKRFEENPSDLSLLSEYLESMQLIVDWAERANNIQDDISNDPVALNEYIETLSRILNKMG